MARQLQQLLTFSQESSKQNN